METISRRQALKLASAAVTLAATPVVAAAESASAAVSQGVPVPQWSVFEASWDGPEKGNPFLDVRLNAVFRQGHREVKATGFYDGAGRYKLRFMPDALGEWEFITQSNEAALHERRGRFLVVAAEAGNHGPVGVERGHHFGYADGTPYLPFGTTSYNWGHQSEANQARTLEALKASPFNKLRMCVFPTRFSDGHQDLALAPYEKRPDGTFDHQRFQPAFFAQVEQQIQALGKLGIEADLILFHPYDAWGFSKMSATEDELYLRYLIARFAAYRNVWWSMANEFDLVRSKTTADFTRLFHVVAEADPYAHLRSIHYSKSMYDYQASWVTHASLQTDAFDQAPRFLSDWNKPVVFDEVKYEGNVARRWGNLTGEELAHRFWLGVVAGCYVSHGETLLPADAPMDETTHVTAWTAEGIELRGSGPELIGFLRNLCQSVIAEHPHLRVGWEAQDDAYYFNAAMRRADDKSAQAVLWYFAEHQPLWYEFSLPAGNYSAELLDTRSAKSSKLEGTFSGKKKIRLAGRPYGAVLFRRLDG